MIIKLRKHIAGLLIALLPILAPYCIYKIPINLILALIFCIVFASRKAYGITGSRVYAIRRYTFLTIIVSFNGLFLGYIENSLLLSLLMTLLSFLLYMPVWADNEFKTTKKYLVTGGYICSGVAVYQCLTLIMGLPYFSGQIPIFDLSSEITGWMPDSFGFRFNSLFSEPSYFAIYLLPILAMSIVHENYINVVFFSLVLILSSSSLGAIGLILIIAYEVIYKQVMIKHYYKVFIVILIFTSIAFYFVLKSDVLVSMLIRSSTKMSEIQEGDSDIRLFGYLYLFETLSIKEMMFGVGLFQLENYFSMEGLHVYNYSNTYVTTILDMGIVGFVIMTIFYFRLYKLSKSSGAIVFLIIFLAISAADPLLFNDRYYYLIFFILYFFQQNNSNHYKET